MKAIRALELLKRHGLISAGWTLRDLKFYKRHLTIWRCRTWEDVVKEFMLARYLSGKKIDEPIRIPEVGLSIGGTMHVEVRTVGERDDGEPVYVIENRGTD